MTNIVFKISSSVLESKIDDEVIVMCTNNGFYYGLDPIGSRIWGIISEKPSTLDEVCTILMEEYDITTEKCLEETTLFLEKMTEEGLIQTNSRLS